MRTVQCEVETTDGIYIDASIDYSYSYCESGNIDDISISSIEISDTPENKRLISILDNLKSSEILLRENGLIEAANQAKSSYEDFIDTIHNGVDIDQLKRITLKLDEEDKSEREIEAYEWQSIVV